MKGFTYKESIDLLEKEIKNASGGGGGGGTAADVSYDNTDSGLTAETVQAAIDEVDGNVDTLSGTVTTLSGDVSDLKEGHLYSTTEKVIGKWTDGSDVYEKVIVFETSVAVQLNATWVSTGVDATGINELISATVKSQKFILNTVSVLIDANLFKLTTVGNMGSGTVNASSMIVRYTKTAPTRTSKKK